ncbi:stress response protein NST1 [Salvia miltiorrhiza]|uniref:stress response protein NST1 n=1 Tax=Salvia miltiorrhiza TaxID=226208 RepID=UPI0025AD37D1|nr:stress response protein NST1 [Salvia miltiorrhiza]XP_057766321.1 stress response protein NST1 [Salvia miltiorrhiza]
MSLSRHLFRRGPSESAVFRHFSTAHTSGSSLAHRHQHEFDPPSSYINSWKPPRNPKEAARQLALLRRDYDRKVKEIRKEYINEMELQRFEKLRKDEARKEALRIANEERRLAKDAKKKAEAIERQAAEEEFRQMLMKERAEKLEYWRMREKKIEELKKEKKDLLRKQSSKWIDEAELVKTAMNSVITDVPIGFPFMK